MKSLVLLLCLLSLYSSAQSPDTTATMTPPPPPLAVDVKNKSEESDIVDFPDVDAQFKGGASLLQEFINKNIRYPIEAIENEEQGKVLVSFIIEVDGSTSNIAIEQSVCKSLDEEAMRIISILPKWIPAETSAVKVRTRCRVPISFTIGYMDQK